MFPSTRFAVPNEVFIYTLSATSNKVNFSDGPMRSRLRKARHKAIIDVKGRSKQMNFDTMTIREAVRRSIETEKNAMDFYRLGAMKMRDAEARRVFELLSGEERDHAGTFHKIYTGDDIPSLDAFLDRHPDHESDWLNALDRIIDSGFNEQKALELAMQKELQLEEVLTGMAERISDPAVRAV